MRLPYLLLFFIIAPTITRAQPAELLHAIRVGVNRAFFGSGDVTGPAFYAEYGYRLSPYVGVAPRVSSGFAHRQDRDNFNHISSFAINLSVRISPLPRYLPGWSLDLGGLYHRFTQTSGNLTNLFGTPTSGDASHYQKNRW